MVFKVNNQLMPFTFFGGNCKSCNRRGSRRSIRRSRGSIRRSRRSRRSRVSHRRRRSSRGRRSSRVRRSSRGRRSIHPKSCKCKVCKCKTCTKCRGGCKCKACHGQSGMKGGFIRAGSHVFNWGDKCPATQQPFKLEK